MSERDDLSSYSASVSLSTAIGQWRNLVRHHRSGLEARIDVVLAEAREIEDSVRRQCGMTMENRRILDIGPGQQLMQMAYFAARGNEVVGVDRDVIVQGFDLVGYIRMARSNGLGRVAKTAGRKVLGIDRGYRRTLARKTGSGGRICRLTVLQRNAWDTGLPADSFDFVYSLRTFMHIHDPQAALEESVRVLAPGGAVLIDLVPYTGPWGALDISVLGGTGEEITPWVHLRPQRRHVVHESAHLNRLSLAEWRELFARTMPGSRLLSDQPGAADLRPLAQSLQVRGELTEFDVEDLLTSRLRVIWQKPATALAP
jgi:SAM-dependent methyltransferase